MPDPIFTHALGLSTALLTALLIKYPDRAIFDEHREGIAYKKGWPLVGQLPAIISNAELMHEFFMNGFNELDSLTT